MIAYYCSGPPQTRFKDVRLRLIAYAPRSHPDADHLLKCTIQVVQNHEPLAEFPLHTEFMTPLELAIAVSESRRDGWTMEFDQKLVVERDRYQVNVHRSRPKFRTKGKLTVCF
jgi:hypothetical protein